MLSSEIRVKRAPPVRVADLLCGAGGTSTGAEIAIASLGRRMELVAINHWDLAIQTHTANHPQATHYCQDIETVKPRNAVPGGVLDLLLASPECTDFSRARAGRPVQDQKRATPWCVPNWCASLYVRCFIVENVPELQDWGPLDSRGRPIRKRRGETFRAWIAALQALGYRVEWRVLNAADYGDPTTRRRLFVIGRRDGRKIRWPEPTHAPEGGTDLLGHSRQRWRSAREVIDWKRKGRSVFLRKTPLKPNTLRRLKAGVSRFFGPWATWYAYLLELEIERSVARWGDKNARQDAARRRGRQESACLIHLRGTSDARSLERPLPAVTAGGTQLAIAEPWLLPQGSNRPGRSPDDPLPTIVTHGKPALIEPFLIGQHSGNAPRGPDDPLMTICAGGAIGVAQGCLVNMKGGSTASSLDDPAPTVTAHARHLGVAEAFVAALAHGNPPGERDPHSRRVSSPDDPLGTITAGGGKYGVAEPFLMPDPGRVRSADDPLPTITTADRGEFAIVEAFIFPANQSDGRARGLRSVDEPVPTILTRDSLGVAEPFIAPYYSEGSGQTGKSVDAPLDTITTKDRFGLAEPAALIVQLDQSGGNGAYVRSADDPLATVTTNGSMAVAEPFLVPNFGERPGQEPRTHAIDKPLPAVTGRGAGAVAEAFVLNRHGDRASGGQRGRAVDEPLPTVTCSGAGYLVQRYGTDLLFRMLDNDELAAGQGFADAPRPYRFVGKKSEVTKQIGNAVPVNLSAALVRAILEG